jgi:hypothetical protein
VIPLDDERWQHLEGGYREEYDASAALSMLEAGSGADESLWEELWENLHHQGDVGVASYAAVPHVARIIRRRNILDYNPFALAVVIELSRGRGSNPELPDWLEESYPRALTDMAEYACENFKRDWDSSLLKAALSLIAIVKGSRDLGELIFEVDEGYEKQLLEKFFEL